MMTSFMRVPQKLVFHQSKYISAIKRIVSTRGATSSHFGGGGNFHEIPFDDVIVIIQPKYNFFANGHI